MFASLAKRRRRRRPVGVACGRGSERTGRRVALTSRLFALASSVRRSGARALGASLCWCCLTRDCRSKERRRTHFVAPTSVRYAFLSRARPSRITSQFGLSCPQTSATERRRLLAEIGPKSFRAYRSRSVKVKSRGLATIVHDAPTSPVFSPLSPSSFSARSGRIASLVVSATSAVHLRPWLRPFLRGVLSPLKKAAEGYSMSAALDRP